MTRPYPGDVSPDVADEPFWQACREHRLLVFRCAGCGRTLWPAGCCPDHGMDTMRWVPASGAGRLHSWTVVQQRYGTSFPDAPPVAAVVELDEGALLHTALVEVTGPVTVGQRVRVVFSEIGDGVVLPYFRPEIPSAGPVSSGGPS